MLKKEDIVKGFEYKEGNSKAVLLIHGFTGSPTEIHPLAEHLFNNGYDVYGPCLKGHGTTLEDMEKTNHSDWLQSVEPVLKQMLNIMTKHIL